MTGMKSYCPRLKICILTLKNAPVRKHCVNCADEDPRQSERNLDSADRTILWSHNQLGACISQSGYQTSFPNSFAH